ncbi:MAG: tRNA 4-thiouridine(8) synthase ThiI [Eubacterium sp.]|jgi:thiamine biosynthesis protein ThiI|nr:tRNA 4-thiouridine(8) synthase ThiI [Eubacterium sp.]
MEIIMLKYGEIALKGQNKRTFEEILLKNIRYRLKSLGNFSYSRMQSTVYVEPKSEDIDIGLAVEKLLAVFGIGAIQRSLVIPKDFEIIAKEAAPYLESSLKRAKTFKVEAKRADKRFPMKSPDLQRELGGKILEAYPHLAVDVHDPDVTILVEIRDNGAYINSERITGAGGIPVGSSGKALLLLSGGIDSPVAAYMMAKRGLKVDAVHFESPPYTTERARIKVESLCEKLTAYCSEIKLYCVNFTELQEAISDNSPEEYFTVIMRRLMLKISNRLCDNNDYHALITGESLGQVASQTLSAINCTDKAAAYPVFRPLCGMDKIEITNIARKIGTFEISSLPYEDCCTIFTPRHPKTKPRLIEVEEIEKRFDYEPLIKKAFSEIEIKFFRF